jgi:hypothetical protein
MFLGRYFFAMLAFFLDVNERAALYRLHGDCILKQNAHDFLTSSAVPLSPTPVATMEVRSDISPAPSATLIICVQSKPTIPKASVPISASNDWAIVLIVRSPASVQNAFVLIHFSFACR